MAIEDSRPERRNLTVMSLAFIAYYYAGGHIADNFQLELVNVTFAYPSLLGGMAWVSLVWFLVRYWQTTTGEMAADFHKELQQHCNTWLLRRYLARSYQRKQGDDRDGFY